MLLLSDLHEEVSLSSHRPAIGTLVGIKGPLLLARLPQTTFGEVCSVELRSGKRLLCEVVSFHEEIVSLAPYDSIEGVSPGARVYSRGHSFSVSLSESLLGCVVDSLGAPLPGTTPPSTEGIPTPLFAAPPSVLSRAPIERVFETGVRTIDGLLTIGYGQRIGLFAGAGVGKSTLLGMIARNADVDVVVVGLIGERGREVGEFIRESLGPEGLKKSVVVVSTSDEPAIRRRIAPITATAIAEFFRDKGANVLLLLDSLTRAARAIREVSLSVGELPVRHGYTPSVYSELPKLLERTGNSSRGSITAIYTVLATPEGEADPLAEEIRSILDGHVVLSPQVSQGGIWPAIDPVASISRLFTQLHNKDYIHHRNTIIQILAKLRRDKDILLLGGTPDAELQAALDLEPDIRKVLSQTPHERGSMKGAQMELSRIAQRYTDSLSSIVSERVRNPTTSTITSERW